MPVCTFWMMLKNIERLESAESLRELGVGFTAARGETEQFQQALLEKIGTTVVTEEEFDPSELKAQLDRAKALQDACVD